jgi:hypothetical protein
VEAGRARSTAAGAGWAGFAGVLFLVLGCFNIIDGIVAIAEDKNFVDERLFFGNLAFWGVVMLVIGILQLVAANGILKLRRSGAMLGVFLASINLVAHLFFLPAFPIWSILIMVIDVMVIYGLTVYADEYK